MPFYSGYSNPDLDWFSRKYSRRYNQSQDSTAKDSTRAFDCCRPRSEASQPKPERRKSQSYACAEPVTHGTYIFPADGRRFASAYPASCRCTCCPHSGFRSSASGERTSHPRHSDSKASGHVSDDPAQSANSSRERSVHSEQSSPGKDRRFSIDVVDNTSASQFSRNRGRFSLSLSSKATVEDILATLIPDRRRLKALVKWDDGVSEPLDHTISVRDLRKDAKYLELRRRKSVHWA